VTQNKNGGWFSNSRLEFMKVKHYFLIWFLFILLSACKGKQYTPGPSETPAATITSSPTYEPIQTSTSTVKPTITSTPTPIPTPLGGSSIFIYDSIEMLWDENFTNIIGSKSNGIFQVDIETKETTNLYSEDYQLEGVSPQGASLLISNGSKLYLVPADGEEAILLSNQFSPREFGYHNWAASFNDSCYWIAEKNMIVFIGLDNGRKQIFKVNPDGTGLTKISNVPEKIISLHGYFNEYVYLSYEYRGGGAQYRINIDTHETLFNSDLSGQYKFSRNGKYEVNASIYNQNDLIIEFRTAGESLVNQVDLGSKLDLDMYEQVWIDNFWISNSNTTLVKFNACEIEGSCGITSPYPILYYC